MIKETGYEWIGNVRDGENQRIVRELQSAPEMRMEGNGIERQESKCLQVNIHWNI